MWDGQDYNRWTIDELQYRVQGMLVRGVVRKVDDGPKMQTVDVQLEDGMRATRVEHWHPYGISYQPHAGAEMIVLALGGNRDHLIAIPVGDRRYRIKVAPGEFAIHDDQGQKVHIKRDKISVETSKDVEVKAEGRCDVEAPNIKLKGAVEIEGDITHTGNMTTSGVHTDANGVHV